MKQALLVVAAAMLAASGSAYAKPDKGAKSHPHGYGVDGCPPGLRAKNPECMPPGQHKKLFQPGQRVPYNFQGLTGYDGLPYDIRHRYGQALDPRSRYIYDNHYLYRVDPATMIVSQVLQTVLRP